MERKRKDGEMNENKRLNLVKCSKWEKKTTWKSLETNLLIREKER